MKNWKLALAAIITGSITAAITAIDSPPRMVIASFFMAAILVVPIMKYMIGNAEAE